MQLYHEDLRARCCKLSGCREETETLAKTNRSCCTATALQQIMSMADGARIAVQRALPCNISHLGWGLGDLNRCSDEAIASTRVHVMASGLALEPARDMGCCCLGGCTAVGLLWGTLVP